MQTNELNRGKLRELADIRPDGAKVLSLYLNLDPTEFASAQARTTEMSSLLDEADRRLRNGSSLTHDEKAHLREDVERVREYFNSADFSAKGAHALAIFASGPADVFEVIKLPRPVETGVAINDTPFLEPLTDLAFTGSWGVFLISRKMARILRGSRDGLEEIARITDDVHGWHDQGGWSQARYQRGIQKEADDHVKHASEVLFRRFRRRPRRRALGPQRAPRRDPHVRAGTERARRGLPELRVGRVRGRELPGRRDAPRSARGHHRDRRPARDHAVRRGHPDPPPRRPRRSRLDCRRAPLLSGAEAIARVSESLKRRPPAADYPA